MIVGSRLLTVACMAADPVPCRESFHGSSERFAAEKLLTHLDAAHVHDGKGPSWGLSWRDTSGHQSLGTVTPPPATHQDY
jgi:hypothetical protein